VPPREDASTLLQLIKQKREHAKRLANENGAAGEIAMLTAGTELMPRPKGKELNLLISALKESGINIKGSSFDAISLPSDCEVDFSDEKSILDNLKNMTFIEIKTANQSRVKSDFSGFFFAITEREIFAAEVLGSQHRVMFYNKQTGATLLTSIPEILARARSMNWQASIQL
jgi:hypothetical protein